MADGDDVVARHKAVSILCISFYASSGRVELDFMLRSAILCFSIRLVTSVRVRLV